MKHHSTTQIPKGQYEVGVYSRSRGQLREIPTNAAFSRLEMYDQDSPYERTITLTKITTQRVIQDHHHGAIDVVKYAIEDMRKRTWREMKECMEAGVDVYISPTSNLPTVQGVSSQHPSLKRITCFYMIDEEDVYRRLFRNGVTDDAVEESIDYAIRKVQKQIEDSYETRQLFNTFKSTGVINT